MTARLLRRLSRTAFRRGRDGSGFWLGVGLVVGALRVLGVLTRRRDDVQQFRLRPGETLVVRDVGRRR